MDRWAWSHLDPWLELRRELPVGRLFCVVRGSTRGRPCASAGTRAQLHHAAALAGSGVGSRHISSGMRARSRCPGRGSRCSSSRDSWGTPT
jgi:hypothetical protein